MASRFIIAVALLAVCHSSPASFGVREQRSYKEADAISYNYGGRNEASAYIKGQNVQAEGRNDQGNYARDGIGNAYRGETKVRVIESDSTPLVGANLQPAYYSAPAPLVTYEQNYAVPNQGAYDAQSYASNGQAISNAQAQTNDPTNIAAKNQGYNSVYTPSYDSASSTAKANSQSGYAASSAKAAQVPARKSISWRFGTAYDHPAAYIGSVPSNNYLASSKAQAVQDSFAKSIADANRGIVTAETKSTGGQGVAAANLRNQGLRSGETYSGDIIRSVPSDHYSIKTEAQTVQDSFAKSIADANRGIVTAETTSTGGQGVAAANLRNQGLIGGARSGEIYYGPADITSNAYSNGQGYALGSADGKIALSSANSYGSGLSSSNSQTRNYGSAPFQPTTIYRVVDPSANSAAQATAYSG